MHAFGATVDRQQPSIRVDLAVTLRQPALVCGVGLRNLGVLRHLCT